MSGLQPMNFAHSLDVGSTQTFFRGVSGWGRGYVGESFYGKFFVGMEIYMEEDPDFPALFIKRSEIKF